MGRGAAGDVLSRLLLVTTRAGGDELKRHNFFGGQLSNAKHLYVKIILNSVKGQARSNFKLSNYLEKQNFVNLDNDLCVP